MTSKSTKVLPYPLLGYILCLLGELKNGNCHSWDQTPNEVNTETSARKTLLFVLFYTDLSLNSGTDLILFGVKQIKEVIKELTNQQ